MSRIQDALILKDWAKEWVDREKDYLLMQQAREALVFAVNHFDDVCFTAITKIRKEE